MKASTWGVLIAVACAGACSGDPVAPPPPPPPPTGLVVSDAAAAPVASAPQSPAVGLATTGVDVAYASVIPGTVPDGITASVRGAAGAWVWTSVVDGGFDPVAIDAQSGDTIEVVVRNGLGGEAYSGRATVMAKRPPVVVRTDPPPKKRDVPLNTTIVVVFSEPVDGATISAASIQLSQAGHAVAGTVGVLQGSGTIVAFKPSALLAPNSEYRLIVTSAVRDLQGESLPANVTVTFTTGTALIAPPASIDLSPDTVVMTSPTYQMTATVRDASGNVLTDQPIVWTTNDASVLSVSATGLLTALQGGGIVTATLNQLSATAAVQVVSGPPTSVAVAPSTATVAVGDTIKLAATARDARGWLVPFPIVGWRSSDTMLARISVLSDSFSLPPRLVATVSGLILGDVTITATSAGASGTAVVSVVPPPRVASVIVAPAAATLQVQDTVRLSATLRAANGRVLTGRSIIWATGDPAVAVVDTSGLVTAVRAGSTAVTATSEGVSGSATITLPAVASVTISPGSPTVVIGGKFTLLATLRDAAGTELINRSITWTSDNIAVATVETGAPISWLTAVGAGSATLTATSEGVNATASVTVVVLSVASVSAGWNHTCAITPTGAAYCWGWGYTGKLGYGSTQDQPWPTAVAGGLAFDQVAAGGYHTCGVATGGAAYCWGENANGQLGNGSSVSRTTPGAVNGALRFTALATGYVHTCGLIATGTAYCWGFDWVTPFHTIPTAVDGGLTFVGLVAGGEHTCGLVASVAYCWGVNGVGELGDSTTTSRAAPVAVRGGLTFVALTVGSNHTCGLTSNGAAYCWGSNTDGQLGNGSSDGHGGGVVPHPTPVPVAGGLAFASLSAGGSHTCGITQSGDAYCWGSNGSYQLGLGDPPVWSNTPAAVVGGLKFASISAGYSHTCGITTSGIVYCWGSNSGGELGTGNLEWSPVPVKVAGQP